MGQCPSRLALGATRGDDISYIICIDHTVEADPGSQGERALRIAIVGQQKFGKAVYEAFLDRGDAVAGVFCAPDRPGAANDPLKAAAEAGAVPVFQLDSLRGERARTILRGLQVDLAIMAYVLQFVPQDFTAIPAYGTIQYHPSLLPRHRGPSAVNWPIILGESETGLSIFRPTDGLDEGPVILQKKVSIGPDETLGQLYFERLFPLGVEALMEASRLVLASGAPALPQDPSAASYEGWCRAPEARVNWHDHGDRIYNLIRGCDPVPGAWTHYKGEKLQLYEAQKRPVRSFAQIAGLAGSIGAISDSGMSVNTHGAQIEIRRVRFKDGAKQSAQDFCREQGIVVGELLDY
jgi:methionyl-tRNA formyltransferase